MSEKENYIHLAYLSIIAIVLISSFFIGHIQGYNEGYDDMLEDQYRLGLEDGYNIGYNSCNDMHELRDSLIDNETIPCYVGMYIEE